MPRGRFTMRRLMIAVALIALCLAAVPAARRHHLRMAEQHEIEASRLYEELIQSPEYLEQEALRVMWFQRDKVPITEPTYKFEMNYSMNLAAEYNRRYGNKVKYHHAQAAKHRKAASQPWIPTWLE
jgi:hypothetical protein